MSNPCRICLHINRVEIDREIVKGVALSKLAKDYRLTLSSLYHHAKEHISRQLVTAVKQKDFFESINLLEKIDSLLQNTQIIFERNFKAKKDITALKALSEQRSTFELLAKISFSLHQAKEMELESRKLESGETFEQMEQEIAEGLSILTDAELAIFIKLQNKIINQSTQIIIKDKKTPELKTDSIDTYIPHTTFDAILDPPTFEEFDNTPIQRTKHTKQMKIRKIQPIEAIQIPSSKDYHY